MRQHFQDMSQDSNPAIHMSKDHFGSGLPLSLLASGSHMAYNPYGPPGGFVAFLHFSAGVPSSETPVGRVPGYPV